MFKMADKRVNDSFHSTSYINTIRNKNIHNYQALHGSWLVIMVKLRYPAGNNHELFLFATTAVGLS